jgi:hypothetical protein
MSMLQTKKGVCQQHQATMFPRGFVPQGGVGHWHSNEQAEKRSQGLVVETAALPSLGQMGRFHYMAR